MSAPICFDGIQEHANRELLYARGSDHHYDIRLGIGTKFIIGLEQREIAAFGIQSDIRSKCNIGPAGSSSYLYYYQ